MSFKLDIRQMNGCAHTCMPVTHACNFSKIKHGRLSEVICVDINEMAGEKLTNTQMVT